MKSFKHWTPRYVYNRIKQMYFEFAHPDMPWITPDAIIALDNLLLPSDIGIEIGSGRSTIWFSKRVKHIYSFEDCEEWYDIIKNKISKLNLTNVSLSYCEKKSKYKESLEGLPGNLKYDFVFIDGGDRGACALKSLDLVKHGGLIVVDNINWYLPSTSYAPGSVKAIDDQTDKNWVDFHEKTKGMRRIWTSNGISDTVIYIV